MTTTPQPPHNAEDEEAVLGSLMIDPAAYADVGPILAPPDFYAVKNGWVYDAIRTVVERGERVDIITLCDELERHKHLEDVGGAAHITELMSIVPSAFNAKQYARIVRDAAVRRSLLNAASEVAKAAHDTSVELEETLARAETAVLGVRRAAGKATDAKALMGHLHDLVTEWMNTPLAEGQTRGLSTGIPPLDRALGGLEPGLYLVAARPSMGKTAFALQCAANIVERGQRVMFFSLEMSADQAGLRLACSRSRVELDQLKRGVATPEEHQRVLESLDVMGEWPLTIVHAGGNLRAGDVRARVQREQVRGEVAAVFVDGLWLMAASKNVENRNLELGSISRELKLAADALGVPVVAVHQLSRAVENRADKRPLLSDLRESGRLEEDADVVLMLYREGYYDPASLDANVAEVWVRKNRLGGPAGRCIKLFWLGKYMRFVELAPCEKAGG